MSLLKYKIFKDNHIDRLIHVSPFPHQHLAEHPEHGRFLVSGGWLCGLWHNLLTRSLVIGISGQHDLCLHMCVYVFVCMDRHILLSALTSILEYMWGFPSGSDGEESACNAGDLGSIPGSGRSPGEGNSYPLQYSCLENSMDRGTWWAIVYQIMYVSCCERSSTKESEKWEAVSFG